MCILTREIDQLFNAIGITCIHAGNKEKSALKRTDRQRLIGFSTMLPYKDVG